jgi:hypothetical protein
VGQWFGFAEPLPYPSVKTWLLPMRVHFRRFAKRGIGGLPHAHEAKRFTALPSGGLGVANPRKMRLFWFFCGYAAKKPEQKGAWGCALNRFHLYCVLVAHGKNRTLARATALWWGLLGFFGSW